MLWAVNVGGVWEPITNPEINLGGAIGGGPWIPIQQGWVNVAGTWQEFYLRGFTINAINITGPGGVTGYIQGQLGTSVPSPAVFQGVTVTEVITSGTNAAQSGTLQIQLVGSFSQSFFTTLTISGNTYPSSQATFSGGNTWFWSVPTTPIHLFVNGQNYVVSWQ